MLPLVEATKMEHDRATFGINSRLLPCGIVMRKRENRVRGKIASCVEKYTINAAKHSRARMCACVAVSFYMQIVRVATCTPEEEERNLATIRPTGRGARKPQQLRQSGVRNMRS